MRDHVLKIGKLELASPVILAPMCGVCDFPYIRLMRRYDRDSLAFHEMFSAVGLMNMHRRKDAPDLRVPEDLKPLGLQLFGHEPDVMAAASQRLVELGAAVVDINLGCPVPKITSGCDGSALLKETALLERILKAMVKAVPDTPVTIKMRLGYSDDHQNYLEVAKLAEQAGVAAITVHGRTRSQMYSGQADWDKIAEVARAVSIPVIGNGDVADPVQALERMRDFGVAGVMVGRGAQGNPWIIPRIAHYARTGEVLPEPGPVERLEVALAHADILIAEKGERQGVSESRKHITWYTRGMIGSAELRAAINATRTHAELVEVVRDFIDRLSGPVAAS
ncbi:MAG TPA: tRNA dihydrouridine synthase DusB [Pantanalinema sp.]